MLTNILPSPQRGTIYQQFPQQQYQQYRSIIQQQTYRIPPKIIIHQQPKTIRQSYHQPRQQFQQQYIYQPSPVRQLRTSFHQNVNATIPITYNQRISQPYNSQQLIYQKQSIPPPRYSQQKHNSYQQQVLSNSIQPYVQQNNIYPTQQQLQNNNTFYEDDLEKKFQDAIDKTKDLVQQFHPKEQLQQQQQLKSESEQQLQQLALQYEDGFIYRGQGFEPSIRQGFGVLTDSQDNEVYSGYWNENQYHGEGKLLNFQEEQFEGPFDYRDLGNIENGWKCYQGEFNEGKMHGKGMLLLTNGEKFVGQFYDGMIDGEGIFTTIDDYDIRGIWKDGLLVQS